MLEEAIKLLERVLNTTSMQSMVDLKDDTQDFLDKYYEGDELID